MEEDAHAPQSPITIPMELEGIDDENRSSTLTLLPLDRNDDGNQDTKAKPDSKLAARNVDGTSSDFADMTVNSTSRDALRIECSPSPSLMENDGAVSTSAKQSAMNRAVAAKYRLILPLVLGPDGRPVITIPPPLPPKQTQTVPPLKTPTPVAATVAALPHTNRSTFAASALGPPLAPKPTPTPTPTHAHDEQAGTVPLKPKSVAIKPSPIRTQYAKTLAIQSKLPHFMALPPKKPHPPTEVPATAIAIATSPIVVPVPFPEPVPLPEAQPVPVTVPNAAYDRAPQPASEPNRTVAQPTATGAPALDSGKDPSRFEVVLSDASWGGHSGHPKFQQLIADHYDAYFDEGGTINDVSQTIDLVIYRLCCEYNPIFIAEQKPKGVQNQIPKAPPIRKILSIMDIRQGHYRSRLINMIRGCFVHAREQRRKTRLKEKGNIDGADPLLCNEEIEPFLDPAVVHYHHHHQQQRQRQQAAAAVAPNPYRLMANAVVATATAESYPPPPHGVMYLPLIAGHVQSQNAPATALRYGHGPWLQTHPTHATGKRLPLSKNSSKPTDKIASKKSHLHSFARYQTFARFQTPDQTGKLTKKNNARVGNSNLIVNRKKTKASTAPKKKQSSQLISSKGRTSINGVPEPMVHVDKLTYDWSSLLLDGAASWNTLLKQKLLDNPSRYSSVPQVTAIDTFCLVQNLKNSLQTIRPPERSPLQESPILPLASTPLKVLVPNNCPADMAPLYPRLATAYHEMVSQDCLSMDPESTSTMLQLSYQYMTADEIRGHLETAEQDVATLESHEERVMSVAKGLGLFTCASPQGDATSGHEDNNCHDVNGSEIVWQADFVDLLKKNGIEPTTRYIMAHDQF